jgi:hypothetical protein
VRLRRVLRTYPVFATAAAGALAGHWLAYALAYGDSRRREAVLAATGHAYLPFASRMAIVVVLAGIGAALLRGLDARGRPAAASPDLRRSPRGELIVRLWLVQAAAFCAMEAGERVVSGVPLSGILRTDLLLLGLGAQLLVAVLGAAFLRFLHRAAAVVASVRGPAAIPARWTSAPLPAGVTSPRASLLASRAAPRAPPSP